MYLYHIKRSKNCNVSFWNFSENLSFLVASTVSTTSLHQVRMVLELLTRLASAGAPLTTMGSQNNVNINEVNNVNNDVNICNSVSQNFNNTFDVSPSSIGRLSVDDKDIEAKPEEAHNVSNKNT